MGLGISASRVLETYAQQTLLYALIYLFYGVFVLPLPIFRPNILQIYLYYISTWSLKEHYFRGRSNRRYFSPKP